MAYPPIVLLIGRSLTLAAIAASLRGQAQLAVRQVDALPAVLAAGQAAPAAVIVDSASAVVTLAALMAAYPRVLLMDEPFVSLDPPTARDVRNLLLQLWQQRPHTVLFVTHDLREAIALADRLIFLASSPMTVISDVAVSIPRKQRHDEAAIEQFRQQLINNHPDIKRLL